MAKKKSRARRRRGARAQDLSGPRAIEHVIPAPVSRAVADLDCWFVIGGHSVRCFCPYRPTRDVVFGVKIPNDLEALLGELSRRGTARSRSSNGASERSNYGSTARTCRSSCWPSWHRSPSSAVKPRKSTNKMVTSRI